MIIKFDADLMRMRCSIFPTTFVRLSEFKRNTVDLLDRLRKTGHPLVLTINGKAELVVQDAAAYQALLDRVEAIEGIPSIGARIERSRARLSKMSSSPSLLRPVTDAHAVSALAPPAHQRTVRRGSFHEPFPAAGIGSGFSDRCLAKNRCVRSVSDIWPRALAAASRRLRSSFGAPLMFFHGVAAPEGSGPMTFSRLPETSASSRLQRHGTARRRCSTSGWHARAICRSCASALAFDRGSWAFASDSFPSTPPPSCCLQVLLSRKSTQDVGHA